MRTNKSIVLRIVLFVILFAIIVGLGYLLIVGRGNIIDHDFLDQENQRLERQIDSLQTVMEQSQVRVDTLWKNIYFHRTIYDTIIQKIPIMPPTQQVAMIDSITGLDIEASVITDNYAMIPLPRIERIAVGLVERGKYKNENIQLHNIIGEQSGQITNLKTIVELKDGQIRIAEANLKGSEEEKKHLRRRITMERIISGTSLVLLFLVPHLRP